MIAAGIFLLHDLDNTYINIPRSPALDIVWACKNLFENRDQPLPIDAAGNIQSGGNPNRRSFSYQRVDLLHPV